MVVSHHVVSLILLTGLIAGTFGSLFLSLGVLGERLSNGLRALLGGIAMGVYIWILIVIFNTLGIGDNLFSNTMGNIGVVICGVVGGIWSAIYFQKDSQAALFEELGDTLRRNLTSPKQLLKNLGSVDIYG